MSKSIKKISEEPAKKRGVTWFPELVNKSEDHQSYYLFMLCRLYANQVYLHSREGCQNPLVLVCEKTGGSTSGINFQHS